MGTGRARPRKAFRTAALILAAMTAADFARMVYMQTPYPLIGVGLRLLLCGILLVLSRNPRV
jgi:hypothetical protein